MRNHKLKARVSSIDFQDIGNYVNNLNKKIESEKLSFQELLPHVQKVFKTSLSSKQELDYCITSLWEANALRIFQCEKYNWINKNISGVVHLDNISSLDGSVVRSVGHQIVASMSALFYNPDVFSPKAKKFVSTFLPIFFGIYAETKKGVSKTSTVLGKSIAQMESFELKLRDNLIVKFHDVGVAVDGSAGVKVMCVNDSNHRCYLENCCLSEENKEKLLSQSHLNSLKPKNYGSITKKVDQETKKEQIVKRSNGTKTLTNIQADDLFKFFKIFLSLETPPQSLNRKNIFTSFGKLDQVLPGYENVREIIKNVIFKLGGKFIDDNKDKADFVICSYSYSRTILGLKNEKNHLLKDKKLVTIKFIAALVFQKCSINDYAYYQFTKTTKPEENICQCSKDPQFNGVEELPHILKSYKKEVQRLNSPQKAEEMFKEFCKRSGINYDVLHFNKGYWMTLMFAFEQVGYIDIESFKRESGGKNKKSPNQMSGKKARNILCGFKETIIPFLRDSLSQEKKNLIVELLSSFSELLFFSYAPLSIISNKDWRLQLWLISFNNRILLKKVFEKNVCKAINLHSHGQFGHLAAFVEKTANEGRTPLQYGTEFSESQFAKQNKVNTNNHIEDLAITWIESAWNRININKDVIRERSGKKKDYISLWEKTHQFKTFTLNNDSETKALLEKLAKYNYKESEHWFYEEGCVRFKSPPSLQNCIFFS
jgi:hypothetical protein